MDKLSQFLTRYNTTSLAGPVLIIMILGMMILPLPAFLLDIFFTFNIAVSIIVLMVGLNTRQPLEFSAFPAVLLVTTLLRLSLNVASSRMILLNGHNGADAAGKVIEAFSHFLVGSNYAIGIVVFIILTIINFVVITKGAGRIAEVSARFTLDAMPGKQMAIDADLNAGLIGEEDAKKRRAQIAEEANFFGSMDGASKFVRGDAIAGIMIMLINIVGGLSVGLIQHDLPLGKALETYTLLTIGDGLVAQIPGLIISTAAGIVVSRVGTEKDLSEQMLGQMFANSQVLYITAAVIGLIGIIPNMPHVAFLLIASSLAGLAWALEKKCVGVSTLEAMAWNGLAAGGITCPVMDARRGQVYNALFRIEAGKPVRLCPDRALSLDELAADIVRLDAPVFLVGDGTELAYDYLSVRGIPCAAAPENLRWQSAWGVAMAASDKIPGTADDLLPIYLRLSQAERERQARLEENK